MSIDVESMKLRVIEPPSNDLQCREVYHVPSCQKAFYTVCITQGSYIIYDAITQDPDAMKELRKVEEGLYDVLVGEESLSDFLERIKNDRKLRHYGTSELYAIPLKYVLS